MIINTDEAFVEYQITLTKKIVSIKQDARAYIDNPVKATYVTPYNEYKHHKESGYQDLVEQSILERLCEQLKRER